MLLSDGLRTFLWIKVLSLILSIEKFDPKQRKVFELFQEFQTISSRQIGELFGFKPRTSTTLCATWVFLAMVDSSDKGRKNRVEYQKLINTK